MCEDIFIYLVCPRLSQESGQNMSPKNSRQQREADWHKVLKLVPKAGKQGLSLDPTSFSEMMNSTKESIR